MEDWILWAPDPEAPHAIVWGDNLVRKTTPEQLEAKYFRYGLDIRHWFHQMKFVGKETALLETKFPEYKRSVEEGINGASVKGILNDRGLAVICAKAELDGHKDLSKSLKMRYDQILDFYRCHVRFLQSERKNITEELGFAPEHPKGLTKDFINSSNHYEKMFRYVTEQNQHKIFLSQLAFSTDKEKIDHIHSMEVETEEHIRLGSIQHLTTLTELQHQHGKENTTEPDESDFKNISGTLSNHDVDEHLLVEMGWNIEKTNSYYKQLDISKLEIDDDDVVNSF